MEISRRTRQVASAVKVELANMLLRDINDHRLQAVGFVTIAEVQLANDHRNATIYVSFMGQEEKSPKVQDALAALNHAKGFLHRALMKKLEMKAIPHLHFRYDRSFDHADKVSRAILSAPRVDSSEE